MLAKLTEELPVGGAFLYEPKWDGFRALVFRGGSEVFIQSRDSRPLDRYFPELHHIFLTALPDGCVLDGEIVIATGHGLDFDALQMRLHPAASRVAKLAKETPAAFVAFDAIAANGRDLRTAPQRERRVQLERLLADVNPPIYLTPMTRDSTVAAEWLSRFEGAGLDGVIAKPELGIYEPGKRTMLKVKHARTAECGVTSSFTMAKRRQLAEELAPLRERALDNHPWRDWAVAGEMNRMPGGQSRWSAGKDLSWEPLRIERVCEVKYDHMQGDRFRHAAVFLRWRPDKRPSDCRYDQLEVTTPYELEKVFGASRR